MLLPDLCKIYYPVILVRQVRKFELTISIRVPSHNRSKTLPPTMMLGGVTYERQ